MNEPDRSSRSDRRRFLAGLLMLTGVPRLAAAAVTGERPVAAPRLQMLAEGYPRSFFWWTTCRQVYENAASPDEADRVLSQLQGLASPSTYLDFFSGFKAHHPEKLVFLFSQGYVFSEKPTVYDPIDRSKLCAGHWVYFEGSRITQDVPAEEGETEIEVERPERFRIAPAEGRPFVDDICLCGLTPDGKPDYRRSEQVQLVSVDRARRTIRVRRGQYSTQPIALAAGKSWAAAHLSEPWGYRDGVSWVANYSPLCPRDQQGRVAADILLEDFAALFAPGGMLAGYDGLEFDVMPFGPHQGIGRQGRGVDTDGDGRADGGMRGSVNVYGLGLFRFAEQLRRRLGAERLFMADGSPLAGHQRLFGVLNGIESEWWPQWGDMDVTHWSCGLNAHRFWQQNCHPPAFGYFIHKIAGHDRKAFLSVPWSRHRLVMAAAQLAGAAMTSFYTPEPEPGEAIGLWDEMVAGTDRRTGWLGQPLGPPVHLARKSPDLLDGQGVGWPAELVGRLQGERAAFTMESGGVRVAATGDAGSLQFALADVPCRQGEDLLVAVRLRAEPRPEYPAPIARHLKLETGEKGQPVLTSFAGREWFDAMFYLRTLNSNRVTLRFTVEGRQPLWLADLRVHAHADAMYRMFEKGLVLANPSDRPFVFDLAAIEPARRYQRLRGSPRQDPKTNDGTPVGKTVTLAARDGLFLMVDDHALPVH